MKTLYIADDGTEFDNEFDCENYEEIETHKEVLDIDFFDINDNPIEMTKDTVFDDRNYFNVYRIVIHSEKELSALNWLAEYCGWCEFEPEYIDSVGTWIYDDSDDGSWQRIK